MQSMKELHLTEIDLISGGITKKQAIIAGVLVCAGVVAAGALYFMLKNSGHDAGADQLFTQNVTDESATSAIDVIPFNPSKTIMTPRSGALAASPLPQARDFAHLGPYLGPKVVKVL